MSVLRVEVVDGKLLIEIGIETLAFAFESQPENEGTWKVSDQLEFAKDVCRALNDESEDGSTPLTRLLDEMMEFAADQGSLGIADC